MRLRNGQALGHVEEGFVARLVPGDAFVFAGRVLELVRVRDLTAWVTPAKARAPLVPRWTGGKMALSTQLAAATRRLIAGAKRGEYAAPEMSRRAAAARAPAALVSASRRRTNGWSSGSHTREGHGLFFYPFEGRLAHIGLATLMSYRLSREVPRTFSLTANDYGFGLLSATPAPLAIGELGRLLAAADVDRDILAGLNAAELARRQFREIARVAGLVFQGYPGEPQSRAPPAGVVSAALQRVRGVRRRESAAAPGGARGAGAQARGAAHRRRARADASSKLVLANPARPTPFAFPLLVEMFREELSTEALEARVARMVEALEAAASE